MKGNIKCKIYDPHQGVLWVKTKTDEIYKNRPLYSWASKYMVMVSGVHLPKL